VWAADVELPTTGFDPDRHLHLVRQAQTFYGPYASAYGLVAVVALYAMSAQAYMHRHQVSTEDAARLSVLLRDHARHNPLAFLRDPIAVEEVIGSRVVSPPLRMLMCAPWADGAVAMVVTREPSQVRVAAFGEAHDPTSFAPLTGALDRFDNAARAGADAYARAGITPREVDVAEVYGAFAVTELQLYEELGFAGPGEAARVVADGRTTHGGDVVVNPSGGRLSLGHPPYVTPLYEVAEVADQRRHRAADRQVAGAHWGLVHAEHGMVNGSLVAILEGS
jgi:benzoylsuccinyl-CoA thiolase BbsB subunit